MKYIQIIINGITWILFGYSIDKKVPFITSRKTYWIPIYSRMKRHPIQRLRIWILGKEMDCIKKRSDEWIKETTKVDREILHRPFTI